MTAIREWLKGKKTYLVAAGAVIAAVVGWADGAIGTYAAIVTILGACGLGSLHALIARLLGEDPGTPS